jgi:two-component system chemotaxis sensor kinase CheA
VSPERKAKDVPVSGVETVRIAASRLDSLLTQVEEMLPVKLAARRRADDLAEAIAALDAWAREWDKMERGIRAAARKAKGSNSNGHADGAAMHDLLQWNRSGFNSLKANLGAQAQLADADARHLDRMVDTLLDDMKQVLMLPFSTLLGPFPKRVRDLARDAGKEAEFTVNGDGIEVDKRILDALRDPLTHLIRNCIDHGIEPPAERERAGKPRSGRIGIAVTLLDGDTVEIAVSDDGVGIDTGAVRSRRPRPA